MASGSAQNNARQMDRLTTCSLCLERFRIPKLLPCLHTFCLTPCLTNLVDPRGRTLRCPECRREHAIPSGGIQNFPSNSNMIDYLDLPPPTMIIDLPDRCFICKQQKQTLIRCNDCSNFVCSDCRETHLREVFYNISSSVTRLRRTLPRLSEKLASYDLRVSSVHTNYEQTRREIIFTVAALIDELKQREAVLLTEAEAYMQAQLNTVRMQQQTGQVELANAASFCDSVGTNYPNGRLVNDADLANIRSECNRHSQEINALHNQIPDDLQKLRLISENQGALSSSIQNFGRLVETLEGPGQQQQQQQPRFSSSEYPQSATHYVTTSQNPRYDQYRHLENMYYSRDSTASEGALLSQTISYLPSQGRASRSVDNSYADLSMTVPARTNQSPYGASRNPQSRRRSTSNVQSSSLFGQNPFAANNSRSNQQPPVPSSREASPRRNYVTSTTAARSIEGDDRPIFGGSGGGGAGRGRSRVPTIPPIQERESGRNNFQRRGTFDLAAPSLPNLPQSGAQRPRDTVVVQELYNVRRRKRARTPVAFTVNLNEPSHSRASGVIDNSAE